MTGRAVQRCSCGFTMAEVLVSILVASIALAVVPSMLRIAGRTTVLARDGTTAIGLAQAKLEELLAQPDLRTDGDDTLAPLAISTTFTRTWRVEPIAPLGEVQRLSATVEWDGGAHQITLETFAWEP
jgi:prepilin-type N-terminal cleavage/methylation domain-containing protein